MVEHDESYICRDFYWLGGCFKVTYSSSTQQGTVQRHNILAFSRHHQCLVTGWIAVFNLLRSVYTLTINTCTPRSRLSQQQNSILQTFLFFLPIIQYHISLWDFCPLKDSPIYFIYILLLFTLYLLYYGEAQGITMYTIVVYILTHWNALQNSKKKLCEYHWWWGISITACRNINIL